MALGDIYTEQEVDETIDKILPVFNQGNGPKIDRDTVRTFVRAENMGDKGGITFANRKSNKNATGVMQVIPETIRGLKGKYLAPDFPEDLSDASLDHQVIAGVATLREMVDRTKTTDWQALARYYNGGTAVGNGTKPMPKETEGYILKGFKAREAMGINDTPLPPTATTVAGPSPAFQTTPLDQANNAYNSMMKLVPALESALFGSNAVAQEAGKTHQASVLAAGEAAATVARTQAEITINENDYHRQLLKAVGLDIEDPNSKLSQEINKEAKTRVEREKLNRQISEMQGVSFFENPLKFLMVQPELQKSVATHNMLANEENAAGSEISRLQTLATTIKTLTPAKSADLLRAKASADASGILAKAQSDAALISANNAAGYAKNMLDSFTLKRNIFHDILQIEGREETIKDRKFNQELRTAQFEALLDERNQKRADKELAAKQETALVTGINLYSKAINGNNVDLTKEDIKRMDPKIRAAWYEVILRGNYGNDYAESIPFIKTFGNSGQAANTGNAALMQMVRNIDARVIPMATKLRNESNAINPMAPMSEKVAIQQAYSKLYSDDALLANKGSDKSELPKSSPYAIDYNAIAVAAAKNPTTTIAKVLVAEKSRQPNMELQMTARSLVEKVQARVLAGEVDPKTAALEISSFYKTANDQQYESAGLKYIGLPAFKDYVIKPGVSGSRTVDLYNPAQLENYLTSEVAKEKRARSSFGNNGFNLWN